MELEFIKTDLITEVILGKTLTMEREFSGKWRGLFTMGSSKTGCLMGLGLKSGQIKLSIQGNTSMAKSVGKAGCSGHPKLNLKIRTSSSLRCMKALSRTTSSMEKGSTLGPMEGIIKGIGFRAK